MIDVTITTVPQEQQRYATAGDYFTDAPLHVSIRVSDLGDSRYEFLVALHEFVEMYLCRARGIQESSIDEFDLAWKGDGEPGDHISCPYFDEHQFASIIERLTARELGVDWDAYNKRLNEI